MSTYIDAQEGKHADGSEQELLSVAEDEKRVLSDYEIVEAIKKTVEDSDWDQLCDFAEHILGGKYTYDVSLDGAILEKNEEYNGAFDMTSSKEEE